MQIEHYIIDSDFFETERDVTVILPPSYGDGRRRFPVLYLHDGSSDWFTRCRLPALLAALVDKGEIPEFITVLPEPVTRTEEYKLAAAHRRFLVDEVVPWIDADFRTRARPSGRAVHGVSLGGLTALWLGLREPGVFGAAGGQGGAYWYGRSRLAREVGRSAPVSTRFFVLCGTGDGNLEHNRALAAAMLERGMCCAYHEVPGRHSWACWRRTLPKALRFYFAEG